jgi:hypothetical protein
MTVNYSALHGIVTAFFVFFASRILRKKEKDRKNQNSKCIKAWKKVCDVN